MKNLIIIIYLSIFTSLIGKAQHTEIEYDSDGSDPHLQITETQDNDYSRLFFRNQGDPSKRWALSGRLGTTDATDDFGLFYNGSPRFLYDESSSKFEIDGFIDLNSTANTAIQVDGDQAIWYDDDHFSWGFGGNWNFFRHNIHIGNSSTEPATTSAIFITNGRDVELYGTGGGIKWTSSPSTDQAAIYVNDDGDDLKVEVGGIEKLEIRKDGGIGIGNTDASSLPNSTEVYVNSDLAIGMDVLNNHTDATIGIRAQILSGGSGTNSGVSGQVNGTGGTGAQYGVIGTAAQRGMGEPASYAVYANGDMAYAGSLMHTSDRKLKKNIKTLNSVLEKVMNLRVKEYEYRKGEFPGLNLAQGPQVGFIAQEVQKVFPELVKSNNYSFTNEKLNSSEFEMYTLNSVALIPILTKAIQEQQELITQQAKMLSQFKSEMSQITDLIGRTNMVEVSDGGQSQDALKEE